ncbi:MAG: adenosine deaminase [Actinobacteria bacterium]|nr:MAG: adenosine deaminase [Actinomycetota bacterium]
MPDSASLDLRATSKVELHRHLEGSLRLRTIIDLSREAGVPLPGRTAAELAPRALLVSPVDSLEDALAGFAIAQSSIRSYDAVRRIAREAVEDLDRENVRLAELRFSPHFLCEPGGLDWDGAMDAVVAGVHEAVDAGCDVAVGLIAIFSRDYGLESARATVDFALRHHDQLVGFDIAGTEVGFPPRTYRQVLSPLLDSGLGLTAHYGESGPPDYPREAIETLGVARLGHGLTVAQDDAVRDLVVARGVVLEMCPTSNWLTGGVASVAEHPVRRLLRDGVKVTINSDDPGYMGIDLSHEWEVARTEIRFTDEDLRTVTRTAIDASFLPQHVKDRVRARHFVWLGEGR